METSSGTAHSTAPVARRTAGRALAEPRSAALFALAAGLLVGAGCEAKAPARLTLDPRGPFAMTKVGQSEQLRPMAFDDKGRPFVGKLDVTYRSSDPSVATVDAEGTIRATGSGDAVITAEAVGLQSEVALRNSIVGSVAFVGTPPAVLRYGSTPVRLEVEVLDDKGRRIDKPKVSFSASDYCVRVSADGEVTPLTIGTCDVEARSAKASARHTIEVR